MIIIDDANGIHFGILPGRILKRNIFELGEEVYFTNKYGCKTHEWKFFNDEVENLINDIKNSPAIGGADEIFGAGYLFLGTFSSDVYADDAYEKILSYVNSEK